MRTKTCSGYRVKDTVTSFYVDAELRTGEDKNISRVFTRRTPPPPDTLEMAQRVLEEWQRGGNQGHLVPVIETA